MITLRATEEIIQQTQPHCLHSTKCAQCTHLEREFVRFQNRSARLERDLEASEARNRETSNFYCDEFDEGREVKEKLERIENKHKREMEIIRDQLKVASARAEKAEKQAKELKEEVQDGKLLRAALHEKEQNEIK